MHNGYYEELDYLKKETEDEDFPVDDFEFMCGNSFYLWDEDLIDNLAKQYPKEKNYIENYTPYEFLHGSCNVFAKALSDIKGLSVSAIYEPDEDAEGIEDYPSKYHLVHMYCTTEDGLYVDIRGVTDSWEEFIKEFIDSGLMLNNEDTVIERDIPKDSEKLELTENSVFSEKWSYELAKLVIEEMFPDYYPENNNKDIEL